MGLRTVVLVIRQVSHSMVDTRRESSPSQESWNVGCPGPTGVRGGPGGHPAHPIVSEVDRLKIKMGRLSGILPPHTHTSPNALPRHIYTHHDGGNHRGSHVLLPVARKTLPPRSTNSTSSAADRLPPNSSTPSAMTTAWRHAWA